MNKVISVFLLLNVIVFSHLIAEEPGRHSHDGFFLRLTAGFGYTHTTINIKDSVKIKGISTNTSLSIGGAVGKDLIFNADIYGTSMSTPTTNYEEDMEVDDLQVSGIGVGITYYFMPSNIYFLGSLGFSKLDQDGKSDSYCYIDGLPYDDFKLESEIGLGIKFSVGKEWWVSDNWGVGLAGLFQYNHANMDSREYSLDQADADTFTLAILFSATFN